MTGSYQFTIEEGTLSGYEVKANADATYDGTAKASATVTEGVPVDAEITFSWTDAAGQPQTSTTVPSFTEPGTYEVSYVISKDGYNDVTGSYQFTIEEGTLSGYEVKGNDAVTYDGNAHASAVVTVGTPADATITFEVGGTSSATVPSFTDAGTYTVNYTISKDNYVDITGSYTFTVDAAELDVELEKNEEVEYSGKPVPAIEEPELPEGVHFTFALFDSKAAAEEGEEPSKVFDEDEIPAFDKPGTYYLGVVIYDKDGNYEIIYDTVTLKITEPAPETGDTFNAGLWVGLLAASAVLAIALFVVLRRRKEQE